MDAVPITVRRRSLMRGLWVGVLALLSLSLLGQACRFFLGYGHVFGLIEFLNVDVENNLPTWYQALALAFSAVLLGLIAKRSGANSEPFANHWLGLCLVFLFLSLDEIGSLHEATLEPLQRITGGMPNGVWAATWTAIALAAVAAVAAVYARFFFRHLDRSERMLVALAAALFVGGAVGIEMLTMEIFLYEGSAYVAVEGGARGHDGIHRPYFKDNFGYTVLAHIEEGLEKIGILVFIDCLLRRLSLGDSFRLVVRP